MFRKVCTALLGVLAMLLAAELLLRALPVSTATRTGYYLDPVISTYPPGHAWQVATGWDLRNSRRLTANNLGFVAAGDFVPDPQAIGLIGDSYVEAGMLDMAERPAAQLAAALLPPRPVYAMGGPGSSLLDYAERIRFASERLGVHDFVVLMETGDVRQSLCGSGNVHGPCLDRDSLQARTELLPGPSMFKRVLRESALAQYVVGQLKFDGARLIKQALAGAVHEAPLAAPGRQTDTAAQQTHRTMMVNAVTEQFFERIRRHAIDRLVFIIDGRRSNVALQDDAALLAPLMRERAAFIELARRHGAVVIDAEALYLQHWARSSLGLSVSPSDGHLNRIGVGLLMRATAESLR